MASCPIAVLPQPPHVHIRETKTFAQVNHYLRAALVPYIDIV